MQAAVHLPQVPFAGPATELPARARDVVDAAGDLGFVGVSANDHFTFSTQWVDGLMLLASIAERAGPLELMTTVALPALRGPVAFASSITALAAMSKGRVVAGVGPGSSAADHGLAGLDWSRRWQRYDETLQVLRSLLGGDGVPAGLRFYAPADQPTAVLTDVPHVQLWPASWGSEAGLRRVAAHGEGWLASAYHTSPDEFGLARTRLEAALRRRGADPGGFGHAVVTMRTYGQRPAGDHPSNTGRCAGTGPRPCARRLAGTGVCGQPRRVHPTRRGLRGAGLPAHAFLADRRRGRTARTACPPCPAGCGAVSRTGLAVRSGGRCRT